MVQRHPRCEHVTGQVAGAGAVPFLQNNYLIPHVAVHKVDPEVSAHRSLPLVAPLWTPDRSGGYR